MTEAPRLAALRVLIGLYVAVWTVARSPELVRVIDFAPRRFDPVGPFAALDHPLPAWLVLGAVVVTPAAALAMALGRRVRVSAPIAALGFLLVTTNRASWGLLVHTENLVALHLCVLALVVWRRRGDGQWAVDAMAVLTVGTYFLAGVAKLRIGGWAWLDGDVLRHQIAFDNARKELVGDTASPFAGWILRESWLLGPAAVMTMVVELGAPLALLDRRIAYVWCGLAVGFHFAIVAFMGILFPYHLLGLALAPLLPVERLGTTVMRCSRRFRAASTTSIPTG